MTTERIKPQIEMDKDTYEQFRSRCGDIPVRWVIEELLKKLAAPGASDMASLSQAIERAKMQGQTGQRRRHGRTPGTRDSYQKTVIRAKP